MITLVSIPKDKIEASWFRVEQLVTEALIRSGGYANSNHFKDWCIQNKCQLWILWDAEETIEAKKLYGVVITEVIQRPLQKCCLYDLITYNYFFNCFSKRMWLFLYLKFLKTFSHPGLAISSILSQSFL